MSIVYAAEDQRLGRQVAIKEMRSGRSVDIAERFEAEAKLLAALDHPGLPGVTDFFSEGTSYYLVMRLIEGRTLSQIRDQCGTVSESRVLRWAEQICDVLDYLHHQSPPVIFRDLKPSNIMEEPSGHIRLIDFGIARLFAPGKESDTRALGTVGYSAPEQYGTGQTDPRSDLYSLGASLHNLLTGHDPATTPFKLPPVRNLNPRVRSQTARVIARCLELDADDRFRSIRDFNSAIRESSNEPATTALSSRSSRIIGLKPPYVHLLGSRSKFVWLSLLFPLVVFVVWTAEHHGATRSHRSPDRAVPLRVPSVVGRSESEALNLLKAAGLRGAVSGRLPYNEPAGEVARQSLSAGSQAVRGVTVRLWVSSGPTLWQRYQNQLLGYAVDCPAKWEQSMNWSRNQARVGFQSRDVKALAVEIITSVGPPSQTPEEAAVQMDLELHHQHGGRHFRDLIRTVKISGEEAQRLTFDVGTKTTGRLRVTLLVVNHDAHQYLILMRAPAVSFGDWQRVFAHIQKSFQFLDGDDSLVSDSRGHKLTQPRAPRYHRRNRSSDPTVPRDGLEPSNFGHLHVQAMGTVNQEGAEIERRARGGGVQVLFTCARGQAVAVVGQLGEWYCVLMADRSLGLIPVSEVSLTWYRPVPDTADSTDRVQ